jgi:arginine-tRNA-protein transferase
MAIGRGYSSLLMSLDFYQDQVHTCSYLEGKQARNLYPDPYKSVDKALYSRLIQYGFRRSGDHIYRPYCPECEACVPVRINTDEFQANRSQSRCLKRNQDIQTKLVPARFSEEHFALYSRYLTRRHQGGGMDNPSQDNYKNFLFSTWCDTGLLECRLNGQLVAVAVTDFVYDGASAFYTFYDPDFPQRSLGTYAILQQIELAKTYGLTWLYLGYWIEDCAKMNYKTKFSGLYGYTKSWRKIDKKL